MSPLTSDELRRVFQDWSQERSAAMGWELQYDDKYSFGYDAFGAGYSLALKQVQEMLSRFEEKQKAITEALKPTN